MDKNEIDELIIDDNYINWVKKFTQEFNNFSNDSWLYCPEEITSEDLKKVNELPMFFILVDDYATKNYLDAKEKKFGYSYDIKLQDTFFEIECMAGQGVSFSITRLENSDNYIDYNDIKEGKLTNRALKINEILTRTKEELSEFMNDEDIDKLVSSKVLKK